MDESFFPSDNIFDPSDPEQALITQQRVVAEAWKDQTEPFRPSFQNLSDERKAILPVDIYQAYGIDRHELAVPLNASSLHQKIQTALISAYDKRGLHFPVKHLYAIANPDETDESPERIHYEGCFNLMGDYCYRMDTPIHLTKEQDEEAFDFFFLLKLAKLPLAEIDSFLEYHRTANFDGDTGAFCRYLSVLMDGVHEVVGFEEAQVSQSQKDVVEKWCDLQLSQRAANSLKLDKEDWGELESFHSEMTIATYRRLIAYFGRYESLKKEKVPRSKSKASTTESPKKFLQLLNESDIELLQDVGLAIPSKKGKKIKPNIGIGDMSLLYFFFHFIWQHNTGSLTSGRAQMVKYLNCWFEFENDVTPDALRKHNVSTDFIKGLNAIWDKR